LLFYVDDYLNYGALIEIEAVAVVSDIIDVTQ
jgi:hypothetical protein